MLSIDIYLKVLTLSTSTSNSSPSPSLSSSPFSSPFTFPLISDSSPSPLYVSSPHPVACSKVAWYVGWELQAWLHPHTWCILNLQALRSCLSSSCSRPCLDSRSCRICARGLVEDASLCCCSYALGCHFLKFGHVRSLGGWNCIGRGGVSAFAGQDGREVCLNYILGDVETQRFDAVRELHRGQISLHFWFHQVFPHICESRRWSRGCFFNESDLSPSDPKK